MLDQIKFILTTLWDVVVLLRLEDRCRSRNNYKCGVRRWMNAKMSIFGTQEHFFFQFRYHCATPVEVFEEWCQKLFPNVTHNAFYYSSKFNKLPRSTSRLIEILDFLCNHQRVISKSDKFTQTSFKNFPFSQEYVYDSHHITAFLIRTY